MLKLLACCLAITGVTWLSYVDSLNGELVFDDGPAIVSNKDVRGMTSLSELMQNDFWGLKMSRPDSMKSYRPITVLSFRLNHNSHGLSPFGYHFVNIVLHALVSILLFLTTIPLFGNGDIAPAFTCAAIFAAHPIHTDAVSSIVGRAEVLSGFFFLLAGKRRNNSSGLDHCWLHRKCVSLCPTHFSSSHFCTFSLSSRLAVGSFMMLAHKCNQSWAGIVTAVVFTACAMLSKEQGIAALPVVAAYNILFIYRIDPANILATLPQAKLGDRKRTLSSLVLTTSTMAVAFFVLAAARWSIGVQAPKVGRERGGERERERKRE
jgi:hypothetical protein